MLIPCSRIPYENRYTIYIDVDEVDKILEIESYSDLCVLGSPFSVKHENLSSRSFLLSDTLRKGLEIRPMVIKDSNPSMPRVIGRFEIMALLQAARYYLLTHNIEQAKSFGLNRAIFYTWIKYNKPHGRFITNYNTSPMSKTKSAIDNGYTVNRKVVKDEIEVRGKYFVFGDQVQKPEDFDKTVAQKIDLVVSFELVWYLTLKYVRAFNIDVLKGPDKFYKHVYEPVRDIYLEQLEKSLKQYLKISIEKNNQGNAKNKPCEESRYIPPVKRITEYIKPLDTSS